MITFRQLKLWEFFYLNFQLGYANKPIQFHKLKGNMSKVWLFYWFINCKWSDWKTCSKRSWELKSCPFFIKLCGYSKTKRPDILQLSKGSITEDCRSRISLALIILRTQLIFRSFIWLLQYTQLHCLNVFWPEW